MSEHVIPNSGVPIKERLFQERPKVKVTSRSPLLDRETIVENAGGNDFYVIHAAARMTRQIQTERRRDEIDPYVTPVDALMRMQKEKVDITDYIMIPPSDEWVHRWYASRSNNVTWNM